MFSPKSWNRNAFLHGSDIASDSCSLVPQIHISGEHDITLTSHATRPPYLHLLHFCQRKWAMVLPLAVSFCWLLNFDIFHHLGLKRLLIIDRWQVQLFFFPWACAAQVPLGYHWQCYESSARLKTGQLLMGFFGSASKSFNSSACLLHYPIRQDNFGPRQEGFSQPYAFASTKSWVFQVLFFQSPHDTTGDVASLCMRVFPFPKSEYNWESKRS